MSFLDIIFGKDISRSWIENPSHPLIVDLERATICGVGEGQAIDALAFLGPASHPQRARQAELVYENRGLRLIHHKGNLTGCEIFFAHDQYTPFVGEFMVGGRTLTFSADTTSKEIIRLLSQPDDQDESEEDGIRYSYSPTDAICMEFMFSSAGQLTAIELI